MSRLVVAVVLLMMCVVLAGAAQAAETDDATLSPYFFIENGDESLDRLPLKSTAAEVRIAGVIADVVVTQTYRNDGTRPIHARYIFPGSTRAAVHGMTFTIGERVIRARIKEREAARQEFVQAKSEGKSAALLEQERPNVFSMSVANILPGDEVRVELHYSELLVPTDGTYEFVYPTVVGPRYSRQVEATAPQSDRWVKSPYLAEGQQPTYGFDLKARIAAGMPLQDFSCTSHKVAIDWIDPSTAQVQLDAGESDGGNRDFILRYRLQGEQVQAGLLLYPGEDGGENFFLLMMQPPQRVRAGQIPPREYIFVVDVSGSMHGFPLNTAKRLMHDLLGSLKTQDSFNLVLFSGASQTLAPASLPATQENIRRATEFIERQHGGGGTELASALKRSYDLPATEGYSRSLVLVTDGYIGEEREAFRLIQKRLGEANVFAFGIGSSVNRYLIEGVAKAGQGEPFIVTRPEEASAKVAEFRAYIDSPVLTDIRVQADGFEAYDLEPPSLPDLFADRPIILFGKWRGVPEGRIHLRGTGGEGDFRQTLIVSAENASPSNGALKYLWARARLARLADYSPTNGNSEQKAEITNLGLTYNLLTAYTSFIAVHEVVRNPQGQGTDVDQPLPLPQGVSELAVGQSVPEPEMVVLLLGLLAGKLLSNRGRRSLARLRKGLGRS